MFLGQFLWFFKVPGRFFTVPNGFYGHSWFQAGFYGSRLFFCVFLRDSRLVFHGFMSVFIFFQSSRSVFHGPRLVFMVFHGSR